MPKFKVQGSVTFAWETELEAADEQEARMTAECEALDGEHLDLGCSDLGRTRVEVLDA